MLRWMSTQPRQPTCSLCRRSVRPAQPVATPGQPGQTDQVGCCPPGEQQTCCDASAKADSAAAPTRTKVAAAGESHRGPGRPDVEAVWRDFRGPMLSFIGRRVSDWDTAEDILQDVMLRVHRHAAELTEVSSVGGWIHEITRNAIIDHYRRAVVRRELRVGVGSKLEPPAEPERVPDDVGAELAACLEPLLAQLPAIYREALQLTDLDGLTQAAAAATRIGLTTSGMKGRVQRGRGQAQSTADRLLRGCARHEGSGVIEYRPQTDDCNCQSSTAKPGKQRAERPAGIRDAGSG